MLSEESEGSPLHTYCRQYLSVPVIIQYFRYPLLNNCTSRPQIVSRLLHSPHSSLVVVHTKRFRHFGQLLLLPPHVNLIKGDVLFMALLLEFDKVPLCC